MAVNIVDIAQASEDKLEKSILMQVLRGSDLIGLLPWITKNTLRVRGTRWQKLPDVGFREFNAGYDEDTGELEQWDDGLFPFGGDIYIDTQYDGLDEMIENPSVTQAKMKLKALAMEFNYYFVEGTPAGGGFIGLRYRIMNDLSARMRINLAAAGDSLKVFAAAANTHDLIDAVHQGIKAVGGKADALLMNEDTYLRFSSAMRRQGLLDVTKDIFDRKVLSFDGAQLVDVGLRSDQATEIITSTEDPGDGGDDATSIYVVRFGTADSGDDTLKEGDGLYGIQKNQLKAYDPLNGGEMESRPAKIRRIDWPVTISPMGDNFTMARIYGFRMRAT